MSNNFSGETDRRLRRNACVMLVAASAILISACNRGPQVAAVEEHWDVLDRYCTDCHNDAEYAGGLSLEAAAPDELRTNPETWEKVVLKLAGDLMPPPGEARPDRETKNTFVAALESTLDSAAAERGPAPGRVAVHRLNRTEYALEIRDLLGIEIDARAILPGDMASDGFDNVAEVLRVSPTHLDQYFAAARDISIRAVGNPKPDPVRADYRSDRHDRTGHVDGLPLGTRGGMIAEHYFPADGTYQFNLNVAAVGGTELRAYPQGWLEYRHKVVMTIDGVKVFEEELGGEADSRAVDQRQIAAVQEIKNRFRNLVLDVPAGVHKVGAAFVARSYAESDQLLESFAPGEGEPSVPRIFGIEIVGPSNPTGISGSVESRERIFSCRPASEAEELPCAERILSDLARRAFRRPVTADDMLPLLDFYRRGSGQGGFETGIQKGLMAILASTKFLYRAEPEDVPSDLEPGTAYPISDIELAWRLSFFLWSQGPDEELLTLAAEGRLSNAAVLDAQVDRLLNDERSRSLVTNFGFQWMSVRRLDQIDPDVRLFPNFDEDLRAAFRAEMELFLDSILRADRSVLDLLTANHTFVNERLARHYEIPSVRGDQFRRIELEDSRRFGLFGKGSVHMVTSYPDRTSPVLRGAWIMEQVLGTPSSSPPPGVETDLAQTEGEVPRSVRERLELHRTIPSCNQCHGVIDPLGQALENFNVVGEWRIRERDSGVLVDPTGQLAGDGAEIYGPDELRNAIVGAPHLFMQSLTEKLMTYALGRGIEYYDMPVVREVTRKAENGGYRFSVIVKAIVASTPFRMREVPQQDSDEVGAANLGVGTEELDRQPLTLGDN